MSKELVKVDNGGAGGDTLLDTAAMLSATRIVLEGISLMTPSQQFIIDKVPLVESDEASVPLSTALVTSGTLPVLTVGSGSVNIGQPEKNVQDWNLMSTAQKLMILNSVAQITKGLTLSSDQGLIKTTEDLITPLTAASLPTSNVPRVQTIVTSNAYFSMFAQSMATSTSDSASISATTPFGGGEASYSHASSHSQSSKSVKTYMVGTFRVNKVLADLTTSKLQVTVGFWNAISKAAAIDDAPTRFVATVEALNKYGWYAPTTLHLGGMLFSTKSTTSSSWSEADSSATSFGASFHAAFDGIGGGASYKHATQKGTASEGAKATSSMTFTAVGGNTAYSNDYEKWAASLEPAAEWNVVSWDTLTPSLSLLTSHQGGKALANFVANDLANNYATALNLNTLQPLIDINNYATSVKDILFG